MNKVQGDQFSLISFWQYQFDKRVYDCERSFATDRILHFQDACDKKHKKKYLFTGNNDEVFFFQQKKDIMSNDSEYFVSILKEEDEINVMDI